MSSSRSGQPPSPKKPAPPRSRLPEGLRPRRFAGLVRGAYDPAVVEDTVWPVGEVARDLHAADRIAGWLGPDRRDEHAAALAAYFVEKYDVDRGARIFPLFTQLSAYLLEHGPRLRELGVLRPSRSPEGAPFEIEPTFLRTLLLALLGRSA